MPALLGLVVAAIIAFLGRAITAIFSTFFLGSVAVFLAWKILLFLGVSFFLIVGLTELINFAESAITNAFNILESSLSGQIIAIISYLGIYDAIALIFSAYTVKLSTTQGNIIVKAASNIN